MSALVGPKDYPFLACAYVSAITLYLLSAQDLIVSLSPNFSHGAVALELRA
jgi:hypothetical protein